MRHNPITLVLIARVPPAGVADFQAYEDAVLPLLADHGGTLQRRLRDADGSTELHIVQFPDETALANYRQDPRRTRHAALLEASHAVMELLRLSDVA
jgi:hypothetical protein